MRYSFALTNALLVLAAASAAHPKLGAVRVDFVLLRDTNPQRLSRRSDLAELGLVNEQTYYSAKLKIGSDGQEVTVLVDTGSLDLWVMSSNVVCDLTDPLADGEDFSDADNDDNDDNDVDRDLYPQLGDASQGKTKRRDADKLVADTTGIGKRNEKKVSSLLSELTSFKTDHPEAEKFASNTSDPGDSGSDPDDSGYRFNKDTDAEDKISTGDYSEPDSCTTYGLFNTDTSNSFKINESAPAFFIEYDDLDSASGFWGSDYVAILSANISNVNFAVVNATNSSFGVLGIGLEGLEETHTLGLKLPYTYENWPLQLKNSGAINKVAYSLFLNDASTKAGLVLFGAVDHGKYSGPLTTVPIINIYPHHYDKPIRLDVVLDSIALEMPSTNTSTVKGPMAALLDSGTTYTYLPSWAVNNLALSWSGNYSESMGLYQLSCNYYANDKYAVFRFSGAAIKVPLSDLVMKNGDSCYLSVLEQLSPDGVEYAVLGDNVLRHAYLVYNLEDYQISLAQASYSSDEDIEVISSTVPLAVSAEHYSSTYLWVPLAASTDHHTSNSLASNLSQTSDLAESLSSLLRKSTAPRTSTTQWTLFAVATLLACFSII